MLLRRVIADRRRAALFLRYSLEAKQALIALRAAWLPHLRAWVLPREAAARAIEAIERTGRERREALRMLGLALSRPQPEAIAPYLSVQVFPLPGRSTAVASLYDAALVAALKTAGARWRPALKAWIVPLCARETAELIEREAGIPGGCAYLHPETVPWQALAGFLEREERPTIDAGAGGAPAAEGERAGQRSDGAREEDLPAPLVAPLERIEPDEEALARMAERLKLYPYQVEGARHLASASSALLADDMGLGKTRSAIAAAAASSPCLPILVACPASLCLNWAAELAGALEQEVCVLGVSGALEGARWIIASYERLGALAQAEGLSFGAMVIDEAHYIKEAGAARTRNAIALAARSRHRMLLTGTPVLNREEELRTLLAIGGHPLGALPPARFRAIFSGSAHARALLRERIGEWMLRRTKEEVMGWLPGKTESAIPIEPPPGFREAYQDELDREAPALGKIQRLRMMLEEAKIDFIAEKAAAVAATEKCLVFCEFLESVSTLMEALGEAGVDAVSLVGEDSIEARERAVERFQNEAQTRVFVSTTRAGGVGLNLTAASAVFFASLPWTPALKRQAEDRANRNGQTRPVTVYVPYVPGTIDEDVRRLLEYKEGIEAQLLTEEAARERLARVVSPPGGRRDLDVAPVSV